MASPILKGTKVNDMAATRQGHMSPIIRWEFTRGNQRISCQVDRQTERGTGAAFAVALVPFPNRSRSSTDLTDSAETFYAVAPALRRHAMLANALRTTGWKLVAYTR